MRYTTILQTEGGGGYSDCSTDDWLHTINTFMRIIADVERRLHFRLVSGDRLVWEIVTLRKPPEAESSAPCGKATVSLIRTMAGMCTTESFVLGVPTSGFGCMFKATCGPLFYGRDNGVLYFSFQYHQKAETVESAVDLIVRGLKA